MTGLIIKIGLVVAALAWGVWLGLPGRYTQTAKDIEEVMERGGGQRRKVKRRFTPLAWMQRNISARSGGSHQRGRSGFKLKSPDER
jgi:hypothetical protein